MRFLRLTEYALSAYTQFMKLSDWMETNGVNASELARRMGHKRADKVLRWAKEVCKPQADEDMQSIFEITNGQVTANDFYNIQ